jgi:CheY-like chemotaxis protein
LIFKQGLSIFSKRNNNRTFIMDAGKKRKILLVDDEVGFAEILRELLQMDGYEVVLVYDGQEALEKLNEYIPNLIISDIMMPRMGGLELYHSVRKNSLFQKIPFMFISGFEDERVLSGIRDDELFGILRKPIDMEQIQKSISKILKD